jgi:hypothetical protein
MNSLYLLTCFYPYYHINLTLFKDSSNNLPSKSSIPDIVSISIPTITNGPLIISLIEHVSCQKRRKIERCEMREESPIMDELIL